MGGEHGVLERRRVGQDVEEAAAGGVALQQLLGVRRGHRGAAAGLLELAHELAEEPAGLHGAAEDLRLGPDQGGVVVADHVPVQQRPEVLGEVEGAVPGGEGVHGRVGEVAQRDPARHERVHLGLGQVGHAAPGHQVQARLAARGLVGEGPAGAVPGAPVDAAAALGELGEQVEGVQAHPAHEHAGPGLHGVPVDVRGDLRPLVVEVVPAARRGGHPCLARAELGRLVPQAQHDGVRGELGGRAVGVAQLQARSAGRRRVQGGDLGAVLDDVGDLGPGAQAGDHVLVEVAQVAAVDRAGRVLVALDAQAGLGVHPAPLVEGLRRRGGAQPGVVSGAGRGEERRGVHEVELGLVRPPHPPGSGRVGVHDVDAQPGRVRAGGRSLQSGEEPLEQHHAAWAGADHRESTDCLLGVGHGASPSRNPCFRARSGRIPQSIGGRQGMLTVRPTLPRGTQAERGGTGRKPRIPAGQRGNLGAAWQLKKSSVRRLTGVLSMRNGEST